MRKMLKENKGFSLVELLVAILIMAVIAGTAITLFGGVLNSSRENADKETAESIKRAILTYMNSTNDVNLSCLGVDSTGSTNSDDLIKWLGLEVTIGADAAHTTFQKPGSAASVTVTTPTPVKEPADIQGKFGPFLDLTKDMNPKTPGAAGWIIEIDSSMQVVSVRSDTTLSLCTVRFVTGSAVS